MSGCGAKSPGISRAAFVGARLFLLEGRRRAPRRPHFGEAPSCGCGSSPRRASRSSPQAGSRRIRQQVVVSDRRRIRSSRRSVGALMALLSEARRRKAGERRSLFDPARKRLLPYMPRVIGVVTSPGGAVIRDILHRLADRFPTSMSWFGRCASRAKLRPRKWRKLRDRRVQCARTRGPHPSTGLADCRARRRFAGGPVELQRGDRRPRGLGKPDSADFGGRSRNRLDPRRSRRRHARADSHRRGGTERAGAFRTPRAARGSRWARTRRDAASGAEAPRRPARAGSRAPFRRSYARGTATTRRSGALGDEAETRAGGIRRALAGRFHAVAPARAPLAAHAGCGLARTPARARAAVGAGGGRADTEISRSPDPGGERTGAGNPGATPSGASTASPPRRSGGTRL